MSIEEVLRQVGDVSAITRRRVTAPSALNEAPAYAKPSSFSRALRIGLGNVSVLLISGTASIGPHGESLHIGDFRAQVRQTFANITALLEAEGATWHDIVRTSCYLRDIEREYEAFNEERRPSTPRRNWIRCPRPPEFKPSCAARNCWWKSKRSRCS